MPKFSVVIPAYNAAPWLGECLDSLLQQTVSNWECICVDDGSTDGSGALLDDYARRDCRVKVVHKANEGAAMARNVGFKASRGEFILFMDGDDLIPREYLAAHIQAREKRPMDAVTFSPYASLESDGRIVAEDDSNYHDYPTIADFAETLMRERWSPVIHGWLWPRAVLEKGGMWRMDIVTHDDLEFSLRQLACCREAICVRDVRAVYRRHTGGLSHAPRNEAFFRSIILSAESRETSALSIRNDAAMRFAVAQWWYAVLFDRDVLQHAWARKVAMRHLERLSMPKCLYMQPGSRRDLLMKLLGPRMMVRLLWLQAKMGLW